MRWTEGEQWRMVSTNACRWELTHSSVSLKSADLLRGLAMVPNCADPAVGNYLRYLPLWVFRLAVYVLGLTRAGKGDRRGEGIIRKEVPFT